MFVVAWWRPRFIRGVSTNVYEHVYKHIERIAQDITARRVVSAETANGPRFYTERASRFQFRVYTDIPRQDAPAGEILVVRVCKLI